MTGYNHYPSCTCGWCAGGGGGKKDLTPISVKPKVLVEPRESKTCLTNCWWCGESVFYHSNGNGDSVLFDSLGWPWEIHACWVDYTNEKKTLDDAIYDSNLGPYPPNPNSYFEDSVSHYTESPETRLSTDHHALFLGTAKLVEGVSSSKYSVFGLSEADLSKHMSLSIKELRRFFGDFYIRYHDDSISIRVFFPLERHRSIKSKSFKERYSLMISVVSEVSEIEKGEFGFYVSSIDLLAKAMSLSVADLQLYFHEIYTVYASGTVYIPKTVPMRLPKKKKIKRIVRHPVMLKSKKLKTASPSSTRGKKKSQLERGLCPYCRSYASNNKAKLNHHIKKHYAE